MGILTDNRMKYEKHVGNIIELEGKKEKELGRSLNFLEFVKIRDDYFKSIGIDRYSWKYTFTNDGFYKNLVLLSGSVSVFATVMIILKGVI